MKIFNFLGYSSYTGYTDLKMKKLKICLLKKFNYEFDLILAMKIYNFLGHGNYTGYTDLKVNFKDPLVVEIKLGIWFDLSHENLQFSWLQQLHRLHRFKNKF